MRNFVITTDTTSDLPAEYVDKHQIGMLSLTYTVNDTTYNWWNPLPVADFYNYMREGSLPTTSQVNPEEAKEIFESIIKEQDADILHIAFSSGLSGSYNSSRIAAEELAEEYPDHKIVIIDSLAASLGEGLLVHKAVTMKEAGHSLEEIAAWIEENKLNVVHNFTVNDLFHLYRGGRVSKTAAFLGTMINLKPILHVDDEGHLIALSKVRGRKKSMTALVDAMEQQIGSYKDKNDVIFIGHGDCEEEAKRVADMIKERLGFESYLINHVGPTIGAHTGPDVIVLCYLGDHR